MTSIIAQAFADWRECRSEYDAVLYAHYEAAAAACNDRLLNRRGQDGDIDPLSLFMGARARAYAYASPELVEWWESHPRVTFSDYERQWVASREAAFA